MTSVILTGVSKALGSAPVLSDVSLSVPSGNRAAIVGASGSGKSTLLRLIAGFEHPDAGTIALGERVVASSDRSTLIAAHKRGVGYVPQDGALFPHLSVAGNIRFGLRRQTLAGAAGRNARVREVASLVALDSRLLQRFPHELSGGQQQRVALARALAPDPGVILLDEPFSALDTGLRAQTRQSVIDALEHSGVTTVLVTHDQEEALCFGQQIALIVDGRIVQSGPPGEVFNNPVTEAVGSFLGDAIVLPASVRDTTVTCQLGVVSVRHDRRVADQQRLSSPSQEARILIRPGQVQIAAGGGSPNATVLAVAEVGAFVDVTVGLEFAATGEATGAPTTLCLRLRGFDRQLEHCVPAKRVVLSVVGGVVVY